MSWSTETDFATVCKRAAGRRRFNAERHAKARERFMLVSKLSSSPEGRKRGSQAKLASILGVHRSTICRDIASWKRLLQEVINYRQQSLMEKHDKTD
jgi:hypothetical protein